MRLIALTVGSERSYIATVESDTGTRDHVFTVSDGPLPLVERSVEFGKDVGFEYSNLVYKAVSAFHDAHHATTAPEQR